MLMELSWEAVMSATSDRRLVTSEEFVTDLVCQLKLNSVEKLRLADTMEDKRFAVAFQKLVASQDQLHIAVDFSLVTNPYHGDSSTLREALYALRERGIVSINNPSFKTVEIQVDDENANYYLEYSAIPREFMVALVAEVFSGADNNNAEGRDPRRN